MTLVVPFDGSELSEAALVRAVEFSTVLDEDIVALVVVPQGNRKYALERGWLNDEESFDLRRVVARLHEQAVFLAPEADFKHITVDKYATSGTIASRIRKFATSEDAAMVFIGSENAGRIVTGVGSVGTKVAGEPTYDLVIIRDATPSKNAKLRESSPFSDPRTEGSPYHNPKSDFHLSE